MFHIQVFDFQLKTTTLYTLIPGNGLCNDALASGLEKSAQENKCTKSTDGRTVQFWTP